MGESGYKTLDLSSLPRFNFRPGERIQFVIPQLLSPASHSPTALLLWLGPEPRPTWRRLYQLPLPL